MKLQIETSKLQDMVAKAAHCVSNNKLIPITSLIELRVTGTGEFLLTTTDGTNLFYVRFPQAVDCESFELSVFADLFIKLVQKITSKEITITTEGNVLVVEGNGTYKLELPLDQGKVIVFPSKFNGEVFDMPVYDEIDLSAIDGIISSNKASLATDMQYPVLTGYYFGDDVVTSNRKTVCWLKKSVLKHPTVFPPIILDLLSVCSGDTAYVYYVSDDKMFIIKCDNELIVAPEFSADTPFPIEVLGKLIEQDFVSTCTLSRKDLLNILDRMALFVTAYDKKGIDLTFTEQGLVVSSKKSSGTELVPYKTIENFAQFSCSINIEYLQAHLSAKDDDDVELSFGADKAIKLVTGDFIQIVALLENTEGK